MFGEDKNVAACRCTFKHFFTPVSCLKTSWCTPPPADGPFTYHIVLYVTNTLSGSRRPSDLVDFVEPVLVGGQLSHEGLMLQPLAVEVPGLVVRRVLSRQHLLVDPHGQLERAEERVRQPNPTQRRRKQSPYSRLECPAGSAAGPGCPGVVQKPPELVFYFCYAYRSTTQASTRTQIKHLSCSHFLVLRGVLSESLLTCL